MYILRTSIHGSEIIENYNPLVDLWHAAERTQSIHGYLPINVTIGLDERPLITYNTPGGIFLFFWFFKYVRYTLVNIFVFLEHFKMGIVAHVRTVTHIKGSKTQTKLKVICPNCPISYTVRSVLPINKLKVNSYSNYKTCNI